MAFSHRVLADYLRWPLHLRATAARTTIGAGQLRTLVEDKGGIARHDLDLLETVCESTILNVVG